MVQASFAFLAAMKRGFLLQGKSLSLDTTNGKIVADGGGAATAKNFVVSKEVTPEISMTKISLENNTDMDIKVGSDGKVVCTPSQSF